MGKMQRNKRIWREKTGKARPKRHGIGKMNAEQWEQRQKLQAHISELFMASLEKWIMHGDHSGQHMTGIMGVDK